MLIKLGEAIAISKDDFRTPDQVFSDPEVLEQFKTTVASLKSFAASDGKVIAPKADDFLYFAAVMMHAAEASLINSDGSLKKDSQGNEVLAHWEKKGESWKWVCSDPNIKPYKNNNCDIFPAEQLIEAHKKWVGKPLCIDHKSSSVDFIRGVIVDTVWDPKHQRIIALCALDKKNHPDLARKVSTGYATCVSMGTAVGRAICTDCGKVARAEADFCNHMRTKSCYGEINVDLNPIELSIVVNGADPQAKIRHIVAAQNSIAQYLEMKQGQLEKLSEDETKDIELAKNVEKDLEDLKNKLTEIEAKVKELRISEETEQAQHDSAKVDDLEVKAFDQIKELDKKLERLLKYSEEQMSDKKAYWLGGGGDNEPSPGKPKYPKEDSDSIRNSQDKQMVGQMDTGPVDGIHPGYDSFGESEEARKKRVLRADEQERKLRREAAVAKAKEKLEAYWLGGGGVNEPTPGKVKYPKEDSDSIREDEDKQMVGQSPFPGVGKVDGLHPSPASVSEKDELKRKQMLARAKLNAKLYSYANVDGTDNKGEARWMVSADKNVILSASVKEIAGGKSELYDVIASKEFGKKVLETIRSEGFDKAQAMFKGGQSMPAMPAMPEVPAPAALPVGPEAPMGPLDPEVPVDAGGTGDVSEELPEMIDKIEETLTEVRKGVNVLMDKDENKLEVTEGMTPATASLIEMKSKLHDGLLLGMKVAEEELQHVALELAAAKKLYDNREKIKSADLEYCNNLTAETLEESKKALANSQELMRKYVKYARGVELVAKRAAKDIKAMKTAQFTPSGLPGDPLDPTLPGDSGSTKPMPVLPEQPKPAPKPVKPAPKKNELPAPYGDRSELESWLINNTRERSGKHTPVPSAPKYNADDAADAAEGCDMDMADDKKDENDAVKVNPDGSMTADSPEEAGKAMKSLKAASTREERMAERAKLAEKAVMLGSILDKAHPKGGAEIKLDSKPSGDLAVIETLKEQHQKILDVVTAPVKVKKASDYQKMAEDIQKLVVAGDINPDTDFPGLIAKGLDSEAVKVWRQFWGQAPDGGSQFATELVKDVAKKKMAEEMESYRVKLGRCYEVAYEMKEKGMLKAGREALKKQVDELMSFNDEAFDSMKRWIDRQASVKSSHIPLVGNTDSFLENEAMSVKSENSIEFLKAELDRAFSTPRRRR